MRAIPNEYIIADQLFHYDPNFNVQRFLIDRGSFLATYRVTDPADNKDYNVASLINKYCSDPKNNVSQKWVLVCLQREQSLISQKTIPTDIHRLDWAMGYGYLEEVPLIMFKYQGFTNQIINAIPRSRELFNQFINPVSVIMDMESWLIPNKFTWLQCQYTPHITTSIIVNAEIWANYWADDMPNFKKKVHS